MISDLNQLQACYRGFLNEHQPDAQGAADSLFVDDLSIEERLSGFFASVDRGDNDQRQLMGGAYSAATRAERIARAAAARDALFALDANLGALFELIVHSLLVRASSDEGLCHGGSSSAAIGLIWMTIDPNASPRDLQEILFHEFTHHLLYIDDLSAPHFDYREMFDPSNFVDTAIYKRSKSVGKVIHSLLVAAEIVLGRERYGWGHEAGIAHPSSLMLIEGIRDAFTRIQAVPAYESLTRPRIRDLVSRALAACDQMSRLEDKLRFEHQPLRTANPSR